MIERIIDLSEEPARLRVRNKLLVIERDSTGETTIPLVDIAALVVSHPCVTFTHAVLSRLAEAGGAFVVCNGSHLPIGMLLPLESHFVQTERFALQASVSLPTRKRLWKQIVKSKVRAQANLLLRLRDEDYGLLSLARRVRSGDPENIESQASRRYWQALFADEGFRRSDDEDHRNAHLNYGYAVLRAVVARAICAAGLHPSLGLHHHNRYDTFCLADDLMEPLRPVVDGVVARRVREREELSSLDATGKKGLLEALLGRFNVDGESRTLFDLVARTASSLADIFAGQRRDLILPE